MAKKNYHRFAKRQKQNNPSNSIDWPRDIKKSADEKIDQDFPGYPHYPAEEDLMRKGNSNGQVNVDVENLSRSRNQNMADTKKMKAKEEVDDNSSLVDEVPEETEATTSDADVTSEDLAMLGPRDADMDMGEDEELGLTGKQNLTGEQLDVPGSELDDANEDIGEEDEENNYYSLGGDNNDALEEPRE